MKKNKQRLARVITCVGISVVLLSTAVFANLDNASGYSTFKKGIKNVVYSDNFSMEANFSVGINDEKILDMNQIIKVDKNSDAKLSSESTSNYYDNSHTNDYNNYYSKSVIQDGYRYNSNESEGSFSTGNKYAYKDSKGSLESMIVNKSESFDKGINFAETLTDALIGDVKNNFVLVDSSNDNKTYTIDMTGEQLPSYVTAGISLMCAQIRQDRNDIVIQPGSEVSESDVVENMFMNEKEPFIDKIAGKVLLDNNDNLVGFDGNIVIKGYNYDGSEISLDFNVDVDFYDYGTTKVERVNPDEYEILGDNVGMYTSVDEDSDGNTITIQSADGTIDENVTIKSYDKDSVDADKAVDKDADKDADDAADKDVNQDADNAANQDADNAADDAADTDIAE